MFKIIFFVTICNIYIIFIFLWYFFPTGIVNLKYTVQGEEIRDVQTNKGKLFIVDHRENPFVDILIMSNECRKIKNKNYLVSAGSQRAKIINYLPKITPFNVVNIPQNISIFFIFYSFLASYFYQLIYFNILKPFYENKCATNFSINAPGGRFKL